jgi:hypothetical protein
MKAVRANKIKRPSPEYRNLVARKLDQSVRIQGSGKVCHAMVGWTRQVQLRKDQHATGTRPTIVASFVQLHLPLTLQSSPCFRCSSKRGDKRSNDRW